MGEIKEIKVGEYVRTEDGLIGKLEQINKEPTDETITYIVTDSFQGMIEEIIKHSKNIIDLIEIGDYVNGELVTGFGYEDVNGAKEKSILVEGKYTKVSFALLEWDIKSIVTKEMFSDIEYRLEN